MSILYPDVSHYQGYISLAGVEALVAKATQGTSFVDPLYSFYRNAAQSRPFAAYHWLDTSPAGQQAVHAFGIVGSKTPLMIDDEQSVINVEHTLEFVHAYRALGGLVTMEYAPRWVWLASGKPDLRPLTDAGLSIVSSDYSAPYSDGGVGFRPYGGVTPTVWQYTSSRIFANKKLDFNGFPGSLDELRAVFMGETTMALSDDDVNKIWAHPINAVSESYNQPVSEYIKWLVTLGRHASTAPPALTDAQLEALAERVAAKLHSLTFSAS